MRIINKHIDRNIVKEGSCQYALELRCADGIFYKHQRLDLIEGFDTFHQDEYSPLEDIVVNLIEKQLHFSTAYTSSSSIAGHHLMEGGCCATIIFWGCSPVICWDDAEEGTDEEEAGWLPMILDEYLDSWEA